MDLSTFKKKVTHPEADLGVERLFVRSALAPGMSDSALRSSLSRVLRAEKKDDTLAPLLSESLADERLPGWVRLALALTLDQDVESLARFAPALAERKLHLERSPGLARLTPGLRLLVAQACAYSPRLTARELPEILDEARDTSWAPTVYEAIPAALGYSKTPEEDLRIVDELDFPTKAEAQRTLLVEILRQGFSLHSETTSRLVELLPGTKPASITGVQASLAEMKALLESPEKGRRLLATALATKDMGSLAPLLAASPEGLHALTEWPLKSYLTNEERLEAALVAARTSVKAAASLMKEFKPGWLTLPQVSALYDALGKDRLLLAAYLAKAIAPEKGYMISSATAELMKSVDRRIVADMAYEHLVFKGGNDVVISETQDKALCVLFDSGSFLPEDTLVRAGYLTSELRSRVRWSNHREGDLEHYEAWIAALPLREFASFLEGEIASPVENVLERALKKARTPAAQHALLSLLEKAGHWDSGAIYPEGKSVIEVAKELRRLELHDSAAALS